MPFEALFSAWGLCALVDISALAIMILDPFRRSMPNPDATATAFRLQLGNRHGATPQVSEMGVLTHPDDRLCKRIWEEKHNHLRMDLGLPQFKIL
jgi:hypothetical protein